MADVCVLPHRYVPGWDGNGAAEESCPVIDLFSALMAEYLTDAHFTPCVWPDKRLQPRIKKEAIEAGAVSPLYHCIVLDVDPPRHGEGMDEADIDAWAEDTLHHVNALPIARSMGWYRSRAGLRLLWTLERPLDHRSFAATWNRVRLHVKDDAGVVSDDLKDLTRLYRLPFVIRDGTPQRYAVDLSGLLNGHLDVSLLPASSGSLSDRAASIAAAKLPLEVPAAIPHGERNVTFFRLAGFLRRIGLSQYEIGHALDAVNMERCADDPLEADEIEKIAQKACKYEASSGLFRPAVAEDEEEVEAEWRPTVLLESGQSHHAATQAEEHLSKTEGVLYQWGDALASLLPDGVILKHDTVTLGRLLAEEMSWVKVKANKDEGFDEILVDPPLPVVQMVLASRRVEAADLRGIIRVPTLRADGTVLDKEGYDQATGLYYLPDPDLHLPTLPATPTRADAEAALDKLRYLFVDFPFQSQAHEAVALANLLTPLVRPAIRGPVPMVLFDSPTPGSGKGLLTDVAAIIATGRKADRRPYLGDNEFAKILPTILDAAPLIVLLDNVDVPLGGASLDAVLTADTVTARVLGTSTEVTRPNTSCYVGTANNFEIRGDLARRALRCRLVPLEERPETRVDLQEPELEQYVLAHRGELIVAALTLLRAYFAAGAPATTKGMGSYREWSRIVRSALLWIGCADPVATQEELRQVGDESLWALGQCLSSARSLSGGRPFLSRELLAMSAGQFGKSTEESQRLREVLGVLVGEGVDLTPHSVGRVLSRYAERVVGGLRFVRAPQRSNNGQQWVCERVGERVADIVQLKNA